MILSNLLGNLQQEMKQEIQYLKKRVKNLFEENMKLRSQIEGITQEMKPV